MAQTHIYHRFASQAWHKLTSTIVLHGRRVAPAYRINDIVSQVRFQVRFLLFAHVLLISLAQSKMWSSDHLSLLCLFWPNVERNDRSCVFQMMFAAWVAPACFNFRPVFCSLRFFFWPVYACPVPACFMVAPACFIFRHVFCFVSFVFLACLRMSCSGMFYGRSGMLYFPTCFLPRFVCFSGLFTYVMFRHVLWSLRHVFRHVVCFASFVLLACLRMSRSGIFYGRSGMLFLPTCFCMFITDMFSACLSSGMFLLSACFGMFDFLACLSTFFFRLVSFPYTFAARYLSSSLWSLREAGPPACLPTFVVATLYVPACFFCRLVSACLLFWHV